MIKIAIPVSKGEISNRFEAVQYFFFYEIDDSEGMKRYRADARLSDKSLIPEWLCKEKINILLTKGIQKEVVRMISQRKIQVYVGCITELPDQAVHDLLKGDLVTNDRYCY